MTPERAEQIDSMLLDSLKDGPKYLNMGYSPVEAIERCFALMDAGKIYMQDGWVYPVPRAAETATSDSSRTNRERAIACSVQH